MTNNKNESSDQTFQLFAILSRKIFGQDVHPIYTWMTVLVQSFQDPDAFLKLSSAVASNFSIPQLVEELRYERSRQQFISSREEFDSIFKTSNQSYALEAIFSALWYSKLPCFDVKGVTSTKDGEKAVVKYCKWKGKEVACSAIFKKVATDKGFCCAFNKPEADKIFSQSRYSSLVNAFETFDRLNAFEQYSGNLDLTSAAGRYFAHLKQFKNEPIRSLQTTFLQKTIWDYSGIRTLNIRREGNHVDH